MNSEQSQSDQTAELTTIEEALRDEQEQQQEEGLARARASSAARNRASRVGATLRFAGVTALLAAAATFLTQHWTGASHLSRYAMFLVFTALVTGAGVLCSSVLKEQKGARAFLGVTLMFLPVHFAQLGALLFSQLGSMPLGVRSYYPCLYWEAPSPGMACAVSALGIAALVPMAYFAFSALARSHADKLMTTAFVSGAALLIPTRDPSCITAILAALAAFALVRDQQVKVFPEMRTIEGRTARLVPLVTIVIVIGRQCALYGASAFLIGALLVGTSYALMRMRPLAPEKLASAAAAEIFAAFFAMAGTLTMSADAYMAFKPAASIAPLVFGLPIAAVMIHLEQRARPCSMLFRAVALIALGVTFVAEYSFSHSLVPSVLGLTLAIVGASVATAAESKTLFWASTVGGLASLIRILELCWQLHLVNPWVVLGVIGVGAVIGGSYVERNFAALTARFRNRMTIVRSWK